MPTHNYQLGGLTEDDEDFGPLSTLTDLLEGLGGSPTEEGRAYAARILDDYLSRDPNSSAGRAPLEQMQAQAGEVKEVLRAARERLAQQQKSKADFMLALGRGLGQPTQTGALGETAGNVAEQLQGVRAGQAEREQEMMGLDLGIARADEGALQAEMQLAQLEERIRGQMAREALRSMRAPGGRGPDQAERIRQELLQRGYPENLAFDIGYGLQDMEVVPQLGVVRGTNVATGQAWEVPLAEFRNIASQIEGVSMPDQRVDSFDLRDSLREGEMSLWDAVMGGTGLWSGVRQGYNIVGGWFNLPLARRTAQQRQALDTAKGELRRSIAINPRFPVGEMDRIDEEIGKVLTPRILSNPALAREQLVIVDSMLRRRMETALDDADDLSLPRDDREAQRSNAGHLRRFLTQLNVPYHERPVRDRLEPPPSLLGAAQEQGMPEEALNELTQNWRFLTDEEQMRMIELYGVFD